MLKPLPQHETATANFVVCDIENNPDGSVIAIDTAFRIGSVDANGSDIVHHQHKTWDDWWSFIRSLALGAEKWRTIYAHNGTGWDWLSFAGWLLDNELPEARSMTAVMAGSRLIVLTVVIEKRCTIRLVDSVHLLKSGLDELSKKFLGSGKVDTGGLLPHELLAENPARFYEYLRGDTEKLLLILERVFRIIRDKVAKIDTLGVTIASTALKIYRTGYQKEIITIPFNANLKSFLREAYKGGRVEVFKQGQYQKVWVYDINSLYPSVMREQAVPVTSEGYWCNAYAPGFCGVYRIRFRQERKDCIPFFVVNGSGSYEGEGVYFSPEIEYFRRCGLGTFEVIEGFIFQDCSVIFREFVDTLYELRMEDKDGPLGIICKWLLNNLYGKFGQRSEREKIIAVHSFDDLYEMVKDEADLYQIDPDRSIWRMLEDCTVAFEHVGIAGMITSAARVKLYEGFSNVGFDNVVYCDTDSVHSIRSMVDNVGSAIGQFKLEFEGEGVYAARKLYALRNGVSGTKVRAKGVRTVSEADRKKKADNPRYELLGADLSYDDIASLLDDKVLSCSYKTPASAREALNGKPTCTFFPRMRRIQRERSKSEKAM
jgi:hypothetical protein